MPRAGNSRLDALHLRLPGALESDLNRALYQRFYHLIAFNCNAE
jgi:hypothetical protein